MKTFLLNAIQAEISKSIFLLVLPFKHSWPSIGRPCHPPLLPRLLHARPYPHSLSSLTDPQTPHLQGTLARKHATYMRTQCARSSDLIPRPCVNDPRVCETSVYRHAYTTRAFARPHSACKLEHGCGIPTPLVS